MEAQSSGGLTRLLLPGTKASSSRISAPEALPRLRPGVSPARPFFAWTGLFGSRFWERRPVSAADVVHGYPRARRRNFDSAAPGPWPACGQSPAPDPRECLRELAQARLAHCGPLPWRGLREKDVVPTRL